MSGLAGGMLAPEGPETSGDPPAGDGGRETAAPRPGALLSPEQRIANLRRDADRRGRDDNWALRMEVRAASIEISSALRDLTWKLSS